MTKVREYRMRVLYMLIAAALAISLFITAAPAQQVSASPGLSEWSGVSTPTTDGWVLAPESNIIDYAMADGGETAYAIVYVYDESHHLLKSTDSAATWQDITDALAEVLEAGQYITELLQVACDAASPGFMAVALEIYDGISASSSVHVFISIDGGGTFGDAGEVEDSGVYLSTISDLEVTPEVYGEHDIAVGGIDDVSNSALFRCTVTGDSAGAWEDATDHDGWDDNGAFTSWVVTDLIFSPSWETDRTILAVTVDDWSWVDGYCIGAVYLQSGVWGEASAAWNEDAGFAPAVLVIEDVYIPSWLVDFDARAISGVSLPLDYSGADTDTRVCWVWVNYFDDNIPMSQGEIFRVRDDAVDSVDTQIMDMPWLTNVSYLGTIAEGKAIAGVLADSDTVPLYPDDLIKECCEGVQVYRNAGITNMEICCLEWDKACKPPTGLFAMAVSYVSEDKAYAVALGGIFDDGMTGYDEGAWSVSFDDGDIWNQLSLIDTYIDYLSDVAVSPDSNKLMLVSVNLGHGCGCDSVWLKANTLPEAEEYSDKWLRTWSSQLGGNWGLLRLAPGETTGDTVVLVDYGTSNVYQNNLEGLACWDRTFPGTISGHVYQSDGTTPIEGAWVSADLVDGGYGMWTTTASDGSYTITGLVTGEYRVDAYAEGYVREYYDGVYEDSAATPVSVTMPDDTPGIDFTLDLGGTISGHVYQADGTTPMEGVWVYAYLIDDGYGRGATTASDGSYTITTLRTGQYRVRAYAEGYIEEYYDGVYGYDQATPVSVTMPDDTPGIDFSLDLGGTISGHVYQSDGTTPIEGARVYADLIDDGYGNGATTASDGSYTIAGLMTGQYRVRAYAEGYIEEYYDGVYDYSEATPVSVTMPDDTPGIEFTLDLGGTISGHVYQSDGTTPVEGAEVYAEPEDGGYGNGATTASDGSYTITGLMTGQYRVDAYSQGYTREYYDGVYDYNEATPVSVTMPDDTPGIDFTLDLGGTISGHVYQSDGITPMEGVWVDAYLIDGGYGNGATTAPDGSYTITGLVTGQYRLRAYAEGYIEEYYDSVYDYDEATPVSVTMPDDTPGIDFTLDLGGTISGHVYQSDGITPIEGAWVDAYLIDGGYGRGANTASDGSYTITTLRTGQYRVRAYAEGYIEEYYDSVYDYNEATPVSVTMPDDTPNIDFTLDLGGTISGHVYQSDGTTPIEGAWVYANLVDGGYGRGTTTASDGSYTITTLRTGQYGVRAYGEGYIGEYYDNVYEESQATPVSVTMPDDTPNIDFTLDLGGTISGHVYQSDGTTPIEGAWVSAYLIDGGYDSGAITASDGSYTITTLITGQYRVRAYSEGYIEEYYDSVYDYNEATPVSVTMPDDTPNIDFTLDLGGTISGHVYEADGTTPIEGAWVYAYLIDDGYGRGANTAADGSYTIAGLMTGQYRVRAYAEGYFEEYYDSVYEYSEATPVSVTMPDDTPDIDFTLDLGGTISGHVYESDGTTPVEGVWVSAELMDGGYGGAASTSADGSYTITTLRTGQYQVWAYPPYWLNLVSGSATAEVIEGETTTVDFVLQAGGIIAGRVTDEVGEGVSEAYLYADGPDYGSAYTDEDGYYSIIGLETGTYTVRIDSQDCSQWYISVNNTLVRYGTSALAEVICGETTQVDFTQQPQSVPDIRVVPSSFNLTLPQGGITNRTLSIGNDGVEVLEFGIKAQVGVLITDPNEEGLIDIKQIFASVNSGSVNFVVQTYSDLPVCDGGWWYEILWLDTDQDSSTGATEEYGQDLGLGGLNDIGADYAVAVSDSQAYLYEWIGEDPWFEPISSLPVNVIRSHFSVSIPLSDIEDDGILDYTLWEYYNNDIVPDNGHGTTKVLADWLSVLPVSGTVDPDNQTEIVVTINATALEIGEYIGYVVIESNDLDESVTYVPVDLAVYLPIEGSIDFEPDLVKLNPKAKGGSVNVYIELPEGFDVQQIDISSIMLNGIVPTLPKSTRVGDYDKDQILDLMVKFSRAAVESLLTPGDQVVITVTGEVAGIAFEGTDTIRVTNK